MPPVEPGGMDPEEDLAASGRWPAALANGVSEELFDKVVIPINLTHPGSADVPSGPGKA